MRLSPSWTLDRVSQRVVGGWVAGIGLTTFALICWFLVPWQPIPGGLPAPADASSVFSGAELARAQDFSQTARWLSLSAYAVGLGFICAVGLSRTGAALTNRLPGRWWVQVICAVVILVGARRLITLPWSVVARERRLEFGLTEQSWAGFARDVAVEAAVSAAVAIIVVGTIIGCARRWNRAWPAVAGVTLMLLTLGASYAYPLVIEPLFNDFESLPASPLREEILDLAASEGVHLDDVLVADASRRTTTLNAYVSGFGSTRRVVLYDNLLNEVPTEQTISVVAHELAHARHHDVVVGTALGAAGVMVGVGILALLLPITSSVGRPSTARDAAVAPRILALIAIAAFVAAPVQNTISRQLETRADLDALSATGDAETVEALQRELALRSLADPSPPPLTQWWFGSHPTPLERIGVARSFSASSSEG